MAKSKRWHASAAVAALVATLGVDQVAAGCPGSQLLDATYSYLVSNPNWGGTAGGNGTCGGYGCYDSQSGPPVSSSMKGVFWALGSGNPLVGVGNDSGLFTGGFASTDFWIKQVSASYQGGLYHFASWISMKLGPPYAVGPPVTWSVPDADGCGPSGNPPSQVCTCFLLTDAWDGVGYFATLSARSDVLGNTNLDPFQTIRLAPIPKPLITNASRDRIFVRPSVFVFGAAEGVYQKDDCGPCVTAYRVLGARVPHASPPPPQSQFVVLPRADGTPQTDTPLGEPVDLLLQCDSLVDENMFLALELVGEGATPFRAGVLSRPSTRISCGTNLAEPERDRGRDSRGDRDRRQR